MGTSCNIPNEESRVECTLVMFAIILTMYELIGGIHKFVHLLIHSSS